MKVILKPDHKGITIPYNGKLYRITPDKETEIPDAMLPMLGDAVMTETDPEPKPKTKTTKTKKQPEPVEIPDTEAPAEDTDNGA